MTVQERILVLLLQVVGAIMLLAWAAIFLPVDWMAAGHRMLGLGEYPASVLVEYLNRSIACLYGIFGGLRLLIARDVRRFRPIVRYLAITDLVFGAIVLGIDLHAGMPWYWTWAEGPPVFAIGLWMLWLLRSIEEPAQPAP